MIQASASPAIADNTTFTLASATDGATMTFMVDEEGPFNYDGPFSVIIIGPFNITATATHPQSGSATSKWEVTQYGKKKTNTTPTSNTTL